MKYCRICCLDKPKSEFYVMKRGNLHSYCKRCCSVRALENYHKNPEAHNARSTKWRKNNLAQFQFLSRRSYLRRCYGISMEQYEELLQSQNGQCAICEVEPVGALAVDHDHKTGKIRGLLCKTCNLELGIVELHPDWIIKVRRYLQKHGPDGSPKPTHHPRCSCMQCQPSKGKK